MIKKIEINFPSFNGLNIVKEFKAGINLLEEPNGWGKTTLLNTIHSFFTGKFTGSKTLPEGIVNLDMTSGKGMLSKSKWIGAGDENELYNYIIPGKFFNLTTVEQRRILTKLLQLDLDAFLSSRLPFYYKGIEKDLNKNLKDNLAKEQIILEDIMRYKSQLINLEKQDFSDVENFLSMRQLVWDKTIEHNSNIGLERREYFDKERELMSLSKVIIPSIESKINDIDTLISNLKTDSKCLACGQALSETHKANELLNLEHERELLCIDLSNTSDKAALLGLEFSSTTEPIELDINDIGNNAKKFLITLPELSIDRHNEYKAYQESLSNMSVITKELELKEELLKSMNTLDIQKNIDLISEAKIEFTKFLESAVRHLPVEIELFKVYKNGNIDESFNIKFKGIDYVNLSTGNKSLVQIMIAKLFVDNLGLDFIMIDEASTISKDNLGYIKELSLSYQIILARATGWLAEDLI